MEHQSTILIMDYDADISAMMEEALLGEGYTVRRCPCHRLGIEAVESFMPDMVIVDLPHTHASDTIALLECLRQGASTHDMAALVTSTDPRLLRDMAGPLQALKCATLSKPFNLEDFLALVARSARGAREAGGACP